MNTQTFEVSVKSLDQILAEQKDQGHTWSIVKPSDFDPQKWTLREVDLSDDKLIPEACEEGRHILESSGLIVEKYVLAEEIKQQVVIPWRAIGMFLGTIALGLGGITLVVGAVALVIKIIVMVLPVLILGAAVVGLLLVDPVLIAVVVNEKPDGTKEAVWVQIAWYYD